MLFLKDSQDYEPKPATEEEEAMGMTLINPDMKTENEIFQERIDKDLVAIGHFSASDIIENSVFQEEFTQLEPGLFEPQAKKSQFSNLKEAKKSRQLSNYKKRNRANTNLRHGNAKEEDEAYRSEERRGETEGCGES